MSLTNFRQARRVTLSNIGRNLGSEIDGAGITGTLIDGLNGIRDLNTILVEQTVKDILLESATAINLESYGNSIGVPRYSKTRLYINKLTYIVFITPKTDYPYRDENIQIVLEDTAVPVTGGVFKFEENVFWNGVDLTIPVSGFFVPAGNTGMVVSSGSVVDVETSVADITATLTITERIQTGGVYEPLEAYRRRLIDFSGKPQYSTEESIEKIIQNYPGVSEYHLDKSVYPYKIYIKGPDAYADVDKSGRTYLYTVPSLAYDISRRNYFNTPFEVIAASGINILVDLRTTDPLLIQSHSRDAFGLYLNRRHRLGSPLTVSITSLREFYRETLKVVPDFTAEFFLSYDNINIKTPEIVLEKSEYLYNVTVDIDGDFDDFEAD